MTEAKTLDELFTKRHVPAIPAPQQKTMPTKKPHGSVKANIIEAFTGRELTVNTLIERLKMKGALSEGSVRSMVSLMVKKGELKVVRKEGREPILSLGSGELTRPQESPKVSVATGGLAADIAALQSALATIRNVEPLIARLLARLEKLNEGIQ